MQRLRRLQRTELSGFRVVGACGLPGPQKHVEFLAFYGSWAIILLTFGGLGRGGLGFRVRLWGLQALDGC